MIKITQIKNDWDQAQQKIEGDDINELINTCLSHIRPRSKEFYKKEIENDLKITGTSLIDYHAGMGTQYEVLLSLRG